MDPKRVPGCLLTRSVNDAITAKVDGTERDCEHAAVQLMIDVIMHSKGHHIDSLYTGDEPDGNITGRRICYALTGTGGITVMFPEDY